MGMFNKLFERIFNNIRSYSVKRKYPIDPNYVNTLPVFDYGSSKSTYNRVFVWGYVSTGALGIPYKTKQLNHIEYIRSPRRLYLAEQNEVTTIGCGFGFTFIGVKSPTNVKVYATGLNTDSQIGYHEVRANKPLSIIFYPQPIHLPLTKPEKSRVKKVAAGRAHSVILTDEGLFCFGNNAYGQCGRNVVADENYSGSRFINHIKKIDNKTIIDIECGQDHSLAVTEDGAVYSCGWGADGQTGLGHFNSQSQFTKLQGDIASEKIVKLSCRSDFVLALNDKGEVFGWGNTEYNQISKQDVQQICIPTHIDMCDKLGNIKDIAAGGSFCVVVNEQGHVYVWGYGILGTGPAVQHSRKPIQISPFLFGVNDFQPDIRVESIACGISHMCAITSQGDLYTWGNNRGCCLGLGNDKDQFFPLKVAMSGLVKYVSCGLDHTVAICKPFI